MTNNDLHSAQIFWNDDNWTVSLDSSENEIDLAADASVGDLAEAFERQVLALSHWLGVSTNVRVHRDGRDLGVIKVRDGEITGWR